MRAAIGITTYNGAARVDELLHSLSMRTPWLARGDASIVLVDDGSPRGQETRDVYHRWQNRLPIRFIEHGTNRGISAGWNTATRGAEAPITVLVNDDVIVSRGWLESLVHVLDHSPDVGVVGQSWHAFTDADVPRLLAGTESDDSVTPRDPISKVETPERRNLYEDTNPARVMAPTGQLFAFRRVDFDAIGGFDEEYLSFYEEICFGTSMAAKLKKIGAQINWPFCWHRWSATFASSPELHAGERLKASQARYRAKWSVPATLALGTECDWTNPQHLGAVPDVEIEFLRKSGEAWRGTLRQDGAFVDSRRAS